MFQIIALWNLARPDKDIENFEVKLRGCSKETFLTGQFLLKLSNKEIKPLSVSDIADFLCPTRRDLYIKKGVNRPKIKARETWGRLAGGIVEKFLQDLLTTNYDEAPKYSDIINKANNMSNGFKKKNNSDIFNKLGELKSRAEEEPDWLLRLLTYNGRAELGFKLLHKVLHEEKDELNLEDMMVTSYQIKPNHLQIGISSPVKPDFLIEKHRIVGDVKSGIGGFKDYYLLTCTGYALAFENMRGKGNDINYGIIYFFPTRHSEYAKPISFVQVYIFKIDDNLREYFIRERDRAYKIISRDSPPDFPAEDKQHCGYCQYFDYCKSQGLKL